MNEEFRTYNSFQCAFKRIEEIEKLMDFLDKEIEMYGRRTTLFETRERLMKEFVTTKTNALNYFKEKGEII